MSNEECTCQNCNEISYEKDVCPRCGHIINERKIRTSKVEAKHNAKPNSFVLFLLCIFIFVTTGNLIWSIITHAPLNIPAIIIDLIFVAVLIFILTRYMLVMKKGNDSDGYVYGYLDDGYEGDNQLRDQTCCILYTKEGKSYMVKQNYNLGNSKIFDVNDRPFIPGTKMTVYQSGNSYVCKKRQEKI